MRSKQKLLSKLITRLVRKTFVQEVMVNVDILIYIC